MSESKTLATVIIHKGLRGKVCAVYDAAQTAACQLEGSKEDMAAGRELEAEHFAHTQGIDAVWRFLEDAGILDREKSMHWSVVDNAFSEIH